MGTRKTRSRETERLVAEHLKSVYPYAVRVPASLPGQDVLNTPGISVEVKARRDLNLPAWLKQAGGRVQDGDLPVVISRPDGYGPERIGIWPVVLTFDSFIRLLVQAGYEIEAESDLLP
jgi:hypothetical protein